MILKEYKIIAIFLLFGLLLPCHVSASSRVTLIYDASTPASQDIVTGFLKTFSGESEQIALSTMTPLQAAQAVGKAAISSDMFLFVGGEALPYAKISAGTSAIYIVLPTDVPALPTRNVSGIVLQVNAQTQLGTMKSIFGDKNRIGLVYNPLQSQQFITAATAEAKAANRVLLALPAISPKDVSAALAALKDQIDVLWMLPDLTLTYPYLMELFTLFSLENNIPLATYSATLLDHGAALSIEYDANDIGRQAGDLANHPPDERQKMVSALTDARKAVITINPSIAEKMGLEIAPAPAYRIHHSHPTY